MANSTALKAKKRCKILHMNVRSLFGKIAEIGAVFNYFDVIVITETWLTDSIPDSVVSISGFNLFRQDRWSYIKKIKVDEFGVTSKTICNMKKCKKTYQL